jgi:proteasome assembly chaperone (PAC2) family protein
VHRLFFRKVLFKNMGITKKVWIDYRDKSKIELNEPIAIVGSSGLRSVGKIVVDELVEKTHPQLFAELYSYGFPAIYYGPSYLGAPSAAGVKIMKANVVQLPSVEFYALERQKQNQDIIITSGYQSYNALNQYAVADKVTDLFKEFQVKKVISLGAQVIEEGITSCATDLELLEEMYKFGIKRTNVDRFIGFSGLVVAIGREKGLKGVCIFANTSQNLANPEYPDFNAAKELLEKVGEIVGITVDTSDLEERRMVERELMEEIIKKEERREKERKREQEREESRGYV